jgi:hypothetical protein
MSDPASAYDPKLLRQLAEVLALAGLDALMREAEKGAAAADQPPAAAQMGSGAATPFDAQIAAGIP